MAKVTFDYSKAKSFVKEEEVKNIESQVLAAKELLVSGTGAGNDFLGWVNLPVDYDKEEFARIQKAAAKIQSDSDVLLVLGIGGSLLYFIDRYGDAGSAYDAVLVSEFDTLEDVARYKNDPRHVAVSSLCKEIRTDRRAIDVTI